MVVGICRITLIIHGNGSLKGKRQVLKSVIGKVKNKFNVSIAEVGGQDLWQRAELGICAAGSDRAFVNSVMDSALNFMEGLHLAEITDHEIEMINC
ncbi:MAG: DUF503 domain-containing protein [Deltaproteobacteria bacterium]|nr:DUF503 domain-containing protein [Deltaproteobacteria bacterium]